MAVDVQNFETFLAQVSSRLRHDLKGGLITVRMGLEGIDDDDIKPLLVEKLVELESLSDKLVKLLRMGSFQQTQIRTSAMMADLESWVQTHLPALTLSMAGLDSVPVWNCDVDAVLMAFVELLENSQRAQAKNCHFEFSKEMGWVKIRVTDDGVGLGVSDSLDQESLSDKLCELGFSHWDSTGLGLSVVRQCVLGHGGTIEHRFEEGSRRLCTLLSFPEVTS